MNSIKEFYVSVDIESTGPIPGDYSMSSLGTFVAGARTDEGFITFDHLDRSNVFYKELQPLNDNFITEAIKVGLLDGFDVETPDPTGSVRLQWMKDHGSPVQKSMQDFADFVNEHAQRLNARPLFMAYPASFDWTFVYWYMVHCGVESPFGFSGVLDLKSYYAGQNNVKFAAANKRSMPKRLFPKLPHTHRADDDAIEQGILGMNILKNAS